MLLANTSLIPSSDMLGLPMPAWLAHFLMALTLALHWLFLTITAGGAAAHVLEKRGGAPQTGPRGLGGFVPFSLSMAMTPGIAPLLFVQVLYGNFFYPANILIAHAWLGLLVAVTLVFYLTYIALRRVRQGRQARVAGVAALVLTAISAMVLSSNATLTQSPGAWDALRGKAGTAFYLGDTTFWPRWTLALCALLCGGGLFLAIYRRIGLGADPAAARQHIVGPLRAATVGAAGILACGLWGSL